MNFWKKGGGHSDPKKIVADLSTSRKKAQHCFPKRGRGAQRPFVSFLKIHLNLGTQASLKSVCKFFSFCVEVLLLFK